MKKTFLMLTMLSFLIAGFAQKPLLAPNGLKVGSTVISATEVQALDGVTSNVQTQLNTKGDLATAIESTTLFYTKKEVQNIRIKDALVAGLQAYGSTVKALPYGLSLSNLFATQTTLADGVYYSALFEIKDTITVTGVGWVQQTQGAYTSDNYNGWAIYTISGGTDTKLVETANDGNIWKAAAGSSTKAFPTTQTLLPGNYKISAIWNASATTTAPIVYAHTIVGGNITYLLPNSQKISATMSAQTTMPGSVVGSSLTSVSNYLGIWLY
jgi:hypothetical protein